MSGEEEKEGGQLQAQHHRLLSLDFTGSPKLWCKKNDRKQHGKLDTTRSMLSVQYMKFIMRPNTLLYIPVYHVLAISIITSIGGNTLAINPFSIPQFFSSSASFLPLHPQLSSTGTLCDKQHAAALLEEKYLPWNSSRTNTKQSRPPVTPHLQRASLPSTACRPVDTHQAPLRST